MTHGSLFSGIGGFDLAAEWVGWKNVFQCEIEPFCQRVLSHHFPYTELHYDIKQTDFSKYRGTIDVVSGGFPCQPFSVAGKRRGTQDERYLWGEMLRAIREIEPRWVVGENVLGIVNWNEGLVFEQVCIDLETAGYEVQPFILPACSTDAPHQRYRVWFIAHSGSDDLQRCGFEKKGNQNGKTQSKRTLSNIGIACSPLQKGIIANTNFERRGKLPYTSKAKGTSKSNELFGEQYPIPNWDNFPTQSPVCCGNDGIPTELHDIAVSKWIKKTIESYGNAVVPQIPFQIFSAINEYENLIKNQKL